MKICRHCPHSRPPGGARLIRKAALRAGFGGTVHIVCYGHDKATKAFTGASDQLDGSFSPQHGITIYQFGPHAKNYKWPRDEEYQFKVFLHELGHHRRHIKGLPQGIGTKEERASERYCDKYAEQEFKELWPS